MTYFMHIADWYYERSRQAEKDGDLALWGAYARRSLSLHRIL